jgi:hypothetical protein
MWTIAALVLATLFTLALFAHQRSKVRRLMPESLFVVRIEPTGLHVVDPKGIAKQVAWGLIERVVIRTTDTGPFAPDEFWLIEPIEDQTIVVPRGATGEAAMLQVMRERLSGFRNDELIEATRCTSNREFVIWERDTLCPRCHAVIPRLPDLSHAQRLSLRQTIDSSGRVAAIKQLRENFGCDLKTAKVWIHHRGVAGQGH